MDAKSKTILGLICALAAAIAFGLVFHACSVRSYQSKLVELQNQVAERDKTIEIQKGVYTKLALQAHNVQDDLDQKDAQVKLLEAQVKKSGQDLLTASSLVVQWKKAYEGLANATQTNVPPDPNKPGSAQRTKVDFHEDFGYVKVDGWTITNPVQSWVRLTQGRPLKITLAISQDKSKAWHSYATSSEDNMAIDIAVASVNPYVLQPKWYEHIGLAADLGVGTNAGGLGALVGLGVNYQFMQFTLGPHVWLGLNNTVDKYYGLSFEWRPFQRK